MPPDRRTATIRRLSSRLVRAAGLEEPFSSGAFRLIEWKDLMKITVIGAGYVGLVTAAGFAEMGNNVMCVEADPDKLRMLGGHCRYTNRGSSRCSRCNVQAGRLSFTGSLAQAAKESDIFFLAVGTPPSADGSPDMSYVYGAAAEVGRTIKRYSILVNKSTVPVGTADRVRSIVEKSFKTRGAKIVRRREQSRIPEGRRRGQGLHESGAHHPRLRQRACREHAAPPLRAFQPQPRPHRRDAAA